MNDYQARLFLSLSETGSLSKTAKDFGVNYQNITYQLDKLEEEFKSKFFERDKKGCVITQSGTLFKTFAKNFLSNYESTKEKITLIEDNILFGVNFQIIQPIVSTFYNNYPNERILYVPMEYPNLYDALRNGEISCFLGHEKVWDKNINYEPLLKDHLCIVTNGKKVLNNKDSITFSELEGLTIDISKHIYVKNAIPLKELAKKNTIKTDSIPAVFEHQILYGQSTTIVPSLYRKLYPMDHLFTSISDSHITFGLYYKNRTKQIDDIIIKLKSISEEFNKTLIEN